MQTMTRAALGGVALILTATGVVVALNWDTVSRNLAAALNTSTEKTQVTLFRLGEVMSIGAELKVHYGSAPDVTYDTDTDDRILGIAFPENAVPPEQSNRDHAREIATFAIGKTKKSDEIDVVTVSFGDAEPHRFMLEELVGEV